MIGRPAGGGARGAPRAGVGYAGITVTLAPPPPAVPPPPPPASLVSLCAERATADAAAAAAVAKPAGPKPLYTIRDWDRERDMASTHKPVDVSRVIDGMGTLGNRFSGAAR